MHKRKMESGQRRGVTNTATATSLGQQRRGNLRHISAVPPVMKDRAKTAYSRRGQATAPSMRSRTSMHSNPPFTIERGSHRHSQNSRQNLHTFSQVSALTDLSSAAFSQTNLPTSQGEQSLKSNRSASQGGGSIPLMPFRQPSLESTSQAATSSKRMTSSQRSFNKSVQFSASGRAPSCTLIQRRNPPHAATATPACTSATSDNALPSRSAVSQTLMTNLMTCNSMRPPVLLRQPQHYSGTPRSSSMSQASAFGASYWMHSGASSTQLSASQSQFGRTDAMHHQTQQSNEMVSVKALMKQFEQMVAEKTRNMEAKETEALTRIQEKTNDFTSHINSKMNDVDSKFEAIDKKTDAFGKSIAAADNLHEARVRFYSDKSQELDGKVTEVTNIIKSEGDSSIDSIKKTYSQMVTKLQDFSTELTNNLHNHPLADMIKNFWKELRRAKDSAGTKKAHAVESSPEGPGTRRRCSPASSSDKSAQTKATKSAKVRVRSAVRKTPQTKRESRVVLSPLEIIKNPPLYPSKRRSEMLDSPSSSKLSVVTPNNLSRSFKRQKSCSMPSSQQYRNGKRGSRNKSHSATSLRCSKTAISDDTYGFLSQSPT